MLVPRNSEEVDAIELEMDINLVLHRVKTSKNKTSQVNGLLVQQALEQLGGKVNKQTDLIAVVISLTGKSFTSCRNMVIKAAKDGHVISEDDLVNQKNKMYSLP